ncbi:MAG: ATP-grasp domain-containing protein [Lachnospiraceae bacterium]|nr:ATP-grasp domain-containing protein [Lachnospiraceae bacterium]
MDKTNILITGTGSLIGQAVIKSINKSGIADRVRLIGCDYFPDTVGSFWCESNHLLPDLLKAEEEENWKAKIYEIVEKENIKVVFIGVDFELLYFADIKEDLYERFGCMVIVSDRKVIETGNDKYLTYQFLKENGINAPDTILLDEWNKEEIFLPCIIKPRNGARSRGVELIKDTDTLRNRKDALSGQGFIIQKAIGTMKSEYTCGILYWNGKYADSIILRRTLKEGNTAFAEFCGNTEEKIVSYIRKIGDALTPFGSCNLQLRCDSEGDPYLFEINPRFSGTTYMRALFGYNEVEYVISRALGWDVPDLAPKPGRIYRFYDERLVES